MSDLGLNCTQIKPKSDIYASINLTSAWNRIHLMEGCQIWAQRGQIGPKLEKSGTISDPISVHFGSPSQNVLKLDQKKFRIYPSLD